MCNRSVTKLQLCREEGGDSIDKGAASLSSEKLHHRNFSALPSPHSSLRESQTGPTTVRSDLQNHINQIRKNDQIQNNLSISQIKAQDLKDYLRVNPVDLKIKKEQKSKNIFDFLNRKTPR